MEISPQEISQERYSESFHFSNTSACLWPQELVCDTVSFPSDGVRNEYLITPYIALLIFFLLSLRNKALRALHINLNNLWLLLLRVLLFLTSLIVHGI